MEIIKTVTNQTCRLKIAGGIDRFARDPLRDALYSAEAFDEIRLDLAKVELAGSVLINLLMEFRNHNPEGSRKIKIVNTPEHALTIFRAFRIPELYHVSRGERV